MAYDASPDGSSSTPQKDEALCSTRTIRVSASRAVEQSAVVVSQVPILSNKIIIPQTVSTGS